MSGPPPDCASTAGFTVVVAEAVLFAVLVSGEVVETVAVLVRNVGLVTVGAVTTMLKLEVPPAGTAVGTITVLPDIVHTIVTWLVVSQNGEVTLVGNVSITWTLAAFPLPRFGTAIV